MKRTRGFTLIEILIALLILSFIGGVIATALISNIRLNADGRIRGQAVAAASTWIDRFKAKTLDFNRFVAGTTYDYGYRYSSDSTFVAAGDPDPTALDREWSPFKFVVQTTKIVEDPVIWRVRVVTYYRRAGGGEGHFTIETLVRQ